MSKKARRATKKKQGSSPAIKLLQHVWDESFNHGLVTRWEVFNNGLRETIGIAVGLLLRFDKDDLDVIDEKFRPGYWFSGEGFYAHAIRAGNRSAIEAWEHYKKREPIIADNVELGWGGGRRGQERLAARFWCDYKGYRVKVTSFKAGSAGLVACWYGDGEEERATPRKQFVVTRESVIADRAEQKRKKELCSLLTTTQTYETRVKLSRALGLGVPGEGAAKEDKERWRGLPLATIEKACAELGISLKPTPATSERSVT